MSRQRYKREWLMLLVVLGGALFLAAMIWTRAAIDGDFALLFGAVPVIVVDAVLFQKVYRRYAAAEESPELDDD